MSDSIVFFLPPDDWLTDDGLVKKEYWDQYVEALKENGLDPKEYEDSKEA